MRTKFISSMLLAASIAVPASAADTDRAVFRLSAVVPTVCRVTFDESAIPIQSGLFDLGQFAELCNDRQGFRITMTHGPELAGAELVIDGQPIPLSATGYTVIVDENEPMERVQAVQLRVGGELASLPNLSFRIEPKGPRF